MVNTNALVCTVCGQTFPLDSLDWRCACGGLFDLAPWPPFDPSRVDAAQSGLWRYRALLPLDPAWQPVTLGEGNTPLVQADWGGQSLYFKLESLAPTGSFKDRGAAVLATALRGIGIRRVVEDSCGNAGASLTAYAAHAGIACEVCVPAGVAGPKLAQIQAHGAEVIEIKGRREYAALAAWAAAAHGAYYASHVYNPYFIAGTETLAYELWEQLKHRAPDALLLPVGNGTLLLGLFRGFERLRQAGLITHMPRLFAVQTEACAPIHQAFVQGREAVEPVTPAPTVATGIAIGQPVRGAQILAAVRASEGSVLSVSEEEIKKAHKQMAGQGLYVEETAAAAVAAVPRLAERLTALVEEVVVVPLTGHGLKTSAGTYG
jgi:threonine synthase